MHQKAVTRTGAKLCPRGWMMRYVSRCRNQSVVNQCSPFGQVTLVVEFNIDTEFAFLAYFSRFLK